MKTQIIFPFWKITKNNSKRKKNTYNHYWTLRFQTVNVYHKRNGQIACDKTVLLMTYRERKLRVREGRPAVTGRWGKERYDFHQLHAFYLDIHIFLFVFWSFWMSFFFAIACKFTHFLLHLMFLFFLFGLIVDVKKMTDWFNNWSPRACHCPSFFFLYTKIILQISKPEFLTFFIYSFH